MPTISDEATKMLNFLSIDGDERRKFKQNPSAFFDKFSVPQAERDKITRGEFKERPAGNECVFFILGGGGAAGPIPVPLNLETKLALRTIAESKAKRNAFKTDPTGTAGNEGLTGTDLQIVESGRFEDRPAGSECVFFILP